MPRVARAKTKEKYGLSWDARLTDADIELYCLRHDTRPEGKGGRLWAYDHYVNYVNIVYNNPDSIRRHVWTKESERMVGELLSKDGRQRFLGVAGGGSLSKSDVWGLFGHVMYASAPTETLVVCTSTGLEVAQQRVWKGVREYWSQYVNYCQQQSRQLHRTVAPIGKAVHSKGRIQGVGADGEYTTTSGIMLVAADKKKGEDLPSKFEGVKAPGENGLLILVADELPHLSDNIIPVIYTNLVNNANFWCVGLGNPNLLQDPHGKFCEPRDGWQSVIQNQPMRWETERGSCIRLDSEQSSRALEFAEWTKEEREKNDTRFPFQPAPEVITAAAKQFGRSSRYFCRMYKGEWCPSKSADAVYSEYELLPAQEQQEPAWDNPRGLVTIGFLDSSYTSGGDRSAAPWAVCGKVEGRKHMHILRTDILEIDDGKDLPPSYQVARTWANKAKKMGVRPIHAGYDNSGAGVSFGQIVDMEWSPDVRKINFGGNPSGRRYRLEGDSKIEFANRVSELWIQPKAYVRGKRDEEGEFHSQITGLTPDIVEELVSRHYDDTAEAAKLRVEKKAKMKARTGKSPDLADAFVGLVEVAIQNGLLDSEEEKQIIRKASKRFNRAGRRLQWRSPIGRKLNFS